MKKREALERQLWSLVFSLHFQVSFFLKFIGLTSESANSHPSTTLRALFSFLIF